MPDALGDPSKFRSNQERFLETLARDLAPQADMTSCKLVGDALANFLSDEVIFQFLDNLLDEEENITFIWTFIAEKDVVFNTDSGSPNHRLERLLAFSLEAKMDRALVDPDRLTVSDDGIRHNVLTWAVNRGHLHLVKLLLQTGAHPERDMLDKMEDDRARKLMRSILSDYKQNEDIVSGHR